MILQTNIITAFDYFVLLAHIPLVGFLVAREDKFILPLMAIIYFMLALHSW